MTQQTISETGIAMDAASILFTSVLDAAALPLSTIVE
jgi:hypothetical protein